MATPYAAFPRPAFDREARPVFTPRDHEVEQERMRHDQALFRYGEYTIFVLMWRPPDHTAGLVTKCPRCASKLPPEVAEAYNQPAQMRCPACFGTTFEGGFKAFIIRPSMWTDTDPDDRTAQRGDITRATITVQSTGDFRMRAGDYIIRADNTRWQVGAVGSDSLATGFTTRSNPDTTTATNFAPATLEDESSVAYLIPPTDALTVRAMLDVSRFGDHPQGLRFPLDFSDSEIIRGPLT